MPELPDVEGFRRVLHEHAHDTPICSIDVHDPKVVRNASATKLRAALVGACFTDETRRGKWLIATAGEHRLVFHFGMTGRLEWCAEGEPTGRSVRLGIGVRAGTLCYRDPRRLRGVWLCEGDDAVEAVTGPLGPDALGITFTQLEERLAPRRGALKPALMDQQVIAGIGNTVVDEVLWRAHLHPRSRYGDLGPPERHLLHRSLTSVLRQSARLGEVPRRPSWLTSQRGLAHPSCPNGHGELSRAKVGGRTTWWCEVCQPEG